MASISISDLYRDEGPGEKYGGILNAVFEEVFAGGIPEGCDERTWTEQLIVKHTFLIAKKMADYSACVLHLFPEPKPEEPRNPSDGYPLPVGRYDPPEEGLVDGGQIRQAVRGINDYVKTLTHIKKRISYPRIRFF